nr:lysylphosphatidylglycerol synthase transmembrane domain-containing protein [Oceanobacter mangrovi]
MLSAVLSAFGYIGFSLWGGWQEVMAAVVQIGLPVTLFALLLSLLNYGLRFVRWQAYLQELGVRLPVMRHAQIYLCGFALTATPGKAGEALRSVLLKPLGVQYSDSIAALLSERFSDILAVLLLAGLVVVAYPEFYPVGILFIGLCCCFGLLLLPASQAWIRQCFTGRENKLALLVSKILNVLARTRDCNPSSLVAGGLLLGVLAWSAEGIAFWLMLHQVGADISWFLAISIYSLSMLAGAASFMPGGLGGAEAAMTAMLTLLGVPLHVAIAVTLMIRLATLWFAVVIGLLMLLLWGRRVPSST